MRVSSAVKFHLNPATGEAGQCRSVAGKCPFGGDEAHFNSLEAAQAAYEATNAESTVAPVAKKRAQPATVVPDPVYVMVDGKQRGELVEVGSSVTIRGVTHEVLEKRIGYKYNTITIAGGKNGTREVNLPLDEEVEVQVRTETDESKARRKAAFREIDLEWAVMNYKPKADEVFAALNETRKRGDLAVGAQIGDLTEAVAQDSLMENFKEKLAWVKAHEPEAEHPHARAIELLTENYREEILEETSRGGHYVNEGQDLMQRAINRARARFLKSPYFI